MEEPFFAVSAANPLLWRDGNLSDSLLAVNGNFEFSSTFSLPALSRRRGWHPVWWRGAETIKHSTTGKRFFREFSFSQLLRQSFRQAAQGIGVVEGIEVHIEQAIALGVQRRGIEGGVEFLLGFHEE